MIIGSTQNTNHPETSKLYEILKSSKMIKYTEDDLITKGYEIKNAKITSVDLDMSDHGCLKLYLFGELYTEGSASVKVM